MDDAPQPGEAAVGDVSKLLRAWTGGDQTALARFDLRKSQVVEMRFFGGLSVEETAEVLKVSPITVMRGWSTVKTWIYRELSGGAGDGV